MFNKKQTLQLRRIKRLAIIFAGRKENAFQKYPQHEEAINYFIANDPSNNLKYLDWQLTILDARKALKEEIAEVTQLFHKFNNKLDQKDINQYKVDDYTPLREQLYKLAEETLESKEVEEENPALEQVKQKKIQEGSQAVYTSDNYIVKHITNKVAACSLGSENWCISNAKRGWFENYEADNYVFFFIFNKNRDDKFSKVAVSIPRDLNNNIMEEHIQYWDINDKSYDESQIQPIIGEEFDKIKSIIYNIAKQQPKSAGAKIANKQATEQDYKQYYKAFEKQTDPEAQKSMAQILLRGEEKTPKWIYLKLAKHSDIGVVENVAANTSTPHEILTELAKHSDIGVVGNVAANTSTPHEILTELAKHSDIVVVRGVAFNKNTPRETLVELAKHSDIVVARSVAFNKNTPHEILVELAKHSDTVVVRNVANNKSTPRETLVELAKHSDIDVVRNVANNKSTPLETLAELAKHSDVVEYVARNTSTPREILAELAKHPDIWVVRNVAKNKNTPSEILAELAKHSNIYVVRGVARNTSTPPETLAELAKHSDVVVVRNVAFNKNTPRETLVELAKHSDIDVVRNVANNKSTPRETLVELAKHSDIEIADGAKETLRKLDQREQQAVLQLRRIKRLAIINTIQIRSIYDPPYNIEEIEKKYPDMAQKIINDPIHKWRAETGIELIHKEPSIEEQERIWENWLKMNDVMKKKSDEKSFEFFDIDNKTHHKKIMNDYNKKHKAGFRKSSKVCPKCNEVLIPLGLYQNDSIWYCPVCEEEILSYEQPGQSSRSDRGEHIGRGVPYNIMFD